jgi:hypothetical protein
VIWQDAHAAAFVFPRTGMENLSLEELRDDVLWERRYTFCTQEPCVPQPNLIPDCRLAEALNNRSSVRHFVQGSVSANVVDTLVACAFVGTDFGRDEYTGVGRPSPAAGAGHSVELYVKPYFVEGWGEQLRHLFVPRTSTGGLMWDILTAVPDVSVFADGFSSDSVLAVVCLTILPERMAYKYGERAYRFSLMEAGHVAQNILLLLNALGFASYPIGGFADVAARREMRLEESGEWPVYFIPFGFVAQGGPPRRAGSDGGSRG